MIRTGGLKHTIAPPFDLHNTAAMSKIPEAGVYAIENTINGRIYVGSATQLDRRMDQHAVELRRGYHRSAAIREDVEQFGADVFNFVVLQRVTDLTELEYLEHVWMRRLSGLGIEGYNTHPARRVANSTPEETALLEFENLFERLTAGITDAEAASVLNRELVITPHGGRTWNGRAVKQARGFIKARQRRRKAEQAFLDSGEAQRLKARVTELRLQGLSWDATLKAISNEGFKVPGTNKAWTRHLLTPLLQENPS